MRNGIVAAAIVAAGIALAGWFMGRGLFEARASDRFVTVKGVAERAVEANIAVWPLVLVASDDDLEKAHDQLERSVKATRAFLTANGIARELVHSQGLSVSDSQSNQYGGREGNRYTITQTLIVRSEDPKQVQAASSEVAELVASGVVLQPGGPYQSAGPSFVFTRLNDLKPDMIAEATARAREAAAKFAQDSGARVGGIRRAHQGVFQILARDEVATIAEQHQL